MCFRTPPSNMGGDAPACAFLEQSSSAGIRIPLQWLEEEGRMSGPMHPPLQKPQGWGHLNCRGSLKGWATQHLL